VKVTGTKAGYETASKTSAQTAAVAAAPKPPSTTPPFTDVSKSQKFSKEITWMYTEGLSTGVETPAGREYQPKTGVSREAMAAFLYRMEGAKYTGPKVSPFADVKPGRQVLQRDHLDVSGRPFDGREAEVGQAELRAEGHGDP
jgi:hypothetical protein